ncbi:2TM domain-containing protein [Flavobacterium ginsenosidimutans]|uniref:2TM domain-containing protein n=1 Tax=Flavobacterium ginsenosidimutans TaxID=687844 RepID=UPI000DAB46D0|nr:2TM domain-containing protein [Flavobacterium ginsenosidimutans]KAF2328832.1 2TM domain-containing protein [Flavobacterium ginsenosidimutans]
MGRFRRHMYEEYAKQHSGEYTGDESYNAAYKKVKKIKGFYSHLKVYIIVNAIIIVSSLSRDHLTEGIDFSGLSEWHTYSTAFFWGIGLLAHGLSVFGSNLFFSEDWEQKKIQKYMEKDAANKNKWE